MAKLINEGWTTKSCDEKGDFVHIWWMCPDIREYWDAVWNQVSQIVGYLLPNDPLVILLGLLSGNAHTKVKNKSLIFSGLTSRASKIVAFTRP
uniref:Uncharacterized protein n=1 Tax=Gopherus agassizii TaxID=38772 RepID=A0A452HJD7_9SAUR